MIWLWEREGQRLTYEVRKTTDPEIYELSVKYPDGSEENERFGSPAALLEGSVGWRDRLWGDGWRPLRPW